MLLIYPKVTQEKQKQLFSCISYPRLPTLELGSLKQPTCIISHIFGGSGIWEQLLWVFLVLRVSDEGAGLLVGAAALRSLTA